MKREKFSVIWAQKQRNEKHEELEKIHKNIDELYGLDMELVEKLGGLDCKEHGSRLALNKHVVNRKIKVVETKVVNRTIRQ